MSHKVIAVHTVIHVPEGSKKQESVAPGTVFTLASKADYDHLKSVGAVKDAGKAAVVEDDAEKAAAEKAAAEKAAAEKAAAEKAAAEKAAAEADAKKAAAGAKKPGKGPVDDVVG